MEIQALNGYFVNFCGPLMGFYEYEADKNAGFYGYFEQI
jgi:hypothetical protein